MCIPLSNMKFGIPLALLVVNSVSGERFKQKSRKCDTPECYKKFILDTIETRSSCDVKSLDEGSLVYLQNCSVDMHSLHTYDKMTGINLEGVYRLHFLTEQCTFMKQEQDEGCHCYAIGWSIKPIMPEEFRKNVCESCGGEYLKNSPPDTFQVKGRGPLRSLGHHDAYAENIKTTNDGGGSANIAVFDIANVESSLVDFSRFPSTLKNDFFVRTNDTTSCKEGDGSACYTSAVYQQDLLKPVDQPCNFGVIRITVEAFVAKSIAILGKATRNLS